MPNRTAFQYAIPQLRSAGHFRPAGIAGCAPLGLSRSVAFTADDSDVNQPNTHFLPLKEDERLTHAENWFGRTPANSPVLAEGLADHTLGRQIASVAGTRIPNSPNGRLFDAKLLLFATR
jgi:hypothetical protein